MLAQAAVRIAEIESERDAARGEADRLLGIIKELQRHRFGRRSERLDPDQLALALEDLEQTLAAAELAEGRKTGRVNALNRRKVNRGALPAHLPRIERVVDIADKACPCCGGALHKIGEDMSERLDVIPAQFAGDWALAQAAAVPEPALTSTIVLAGILLGRRRTPA